MRRCELHAGMRAVCEVRGYRFHAKILDARADGGMVRVHPDSGTHHHVTPRQVIAAEQGWSPWDAVRRA